ncbi:DNA-binding protein [Castellaniella ginsengisoli]
MLDLSRYDGPSGFLVDTNLWIDCMTPDSRWHEWSIGQIQRCRKQAPPHINLVIYTELLIPDPDVKALDAMLDVYDTLRSPLPWTCAGLAANAYQRYRRSGGTRRVPLPDF